MRDAEDGVRKQRPPREEWREGALQDSGRFHGDHDGRENHGPMRPTGTTKDAKFSSFINCGGRPLIKNTHIINSSGQDISGQSGRGHKGFYEKGRK